jgi:ABC-2 type transport system ATP-binding protein
VKGLSRSFGALRAVDGLSFDVPHGQVSRFLAPKRAGMTTTIPALR